MDGAKSMSTRRVGRHRGRHRTKTYCMQEIDGLMAAVQAGVRRLAR